MMALALHMHARLVAIGGQDARAEGGRGDARRARARREACAASRPRRRRRSPATRGRQACGSVARFRCARARDAASGSAGDHAWKAAGRRETEGSAVEAPEAGGSGEKNLKENQIQLPKVKRSAELTFTCNKCEHRTTRMVNPEVYKKGTMFVQCAGCEVWHKMVDNLGLMYEFPAEEQ